MAAGGAPATVRDPRRTAGTDSGETELEENGGLPFASVADARTSATAPRALGGGNAVRFPLSWAHAEPVRGRVDTACPAAVTEQMRALLRHRHPGLP
ncbi:hypothetical protein GCM10010345_37930 [Streptomyces canarius]|uniref:Uncharacterized protein n=1 Tax=Streptomyces canarius TaxID=285453 RepID=A0ABQ3CPC0_9ACTN|nr:hypothetical protein GCM10010345_37930 [Streptomyces canarius]